MELKKPQPSRLVGGTQTIMGWSHTHMWQIKIQEGYLRSKESQAHTRPPAQGSNAKKISPHNFWLQKSVGIESVEETAGALSNFS